MIPVSKRSILVTLDDSLNSVCAPLCTVLISVVPGDGRPVNVDDIMME